MDSNYFNFFFLTIRQKIKKRLFKFHLLPASVPLNLSR